MILSLDTSVVVDLLRGREMGVRDRFAAARKAGSNLKLSAVALYELTYGAHRSQAPQRHLANLEDLLTYVEVAPFEGDDAVTAGRARREIEATGQAIGALDLLIGSQALARGWAVVSSNARDFMRLRDLKLVDWRRSDELLSAADIIARLTGRLED